MKISKILSRLIAILLFCTVSSFAAVLDTDDFQSNLEDWSGTGVARLSSTKVMEIDSQSVASKTYTYTAEANKSFTLTLSAVKMSTWESSDTITIKFNGVTVYNSNTAGALTLRGGFDSSGIVTVTIQANTDTAVEKLQIDNVVLSQNATYTTSNERPFTLQYTANEIGDMVTFGNTILCKSSIQNASYKTGTCSEPGTADSNDNIYTLYSKLSSDDANSSIFNSSSSDLTIPSGSTVLKAILYWQGGINSNTIDDTTGDASLSNLTTAMEKARTVQLKVPGSASYVTVRSEGAKFNWSNSSATYNYYQGAADVTSLVQQSGTYQLANLVANDGNLGGGTGPYGGWAIMLVYQDLSSGTSYLKNMVIYDGYKLVTDDISQTFSGFYTPISGDVNAKFTMFATEADATRTDAITMTQTSSTGTAVSIATNELDSSIKDASGASVTTRSPSYSNTIGTDIHTWDVGDNNDGIRDIIGNSQSSTRVVFDYGNDIFNLGAFSFATDLYQPQVCYIENIFKGTTNISGIGAQVNEDDNLTVRVYIKNIGNDNAEKVQILHQFDNEFPYVASSANYNNNNPAYEVLMPPSYTRTTASDSSGNDLYVYDTSTRISKINLGNLATSGDGGLFYPASSATPTYAVYEYNATVKALDNNYSNVYKAAYKNVALGIDYSNNPVTMQSCDGSINSFWGYSATPVNSGSVDVVDGYSGSGGTYNSWITTKVSKQPNVTLHAVYLGNDSANPVPQSYPGNNQSASLTLLYKLADMSNGATCETAPTVNLTTTIGGNTPVVAVIDPGETSQESNAFVMGYVPSGTTTLAKKDLRIKYKVVDFNSLIDTSGVTCAQKSSTGGVVEGIPACLIAQPNDNTDNTNQAIQNYKTVFGLAAYTSCYTENGQPCASSNGGVGAAPYDHAYGCYECSIGAMPYTCSRDNFAIRPKEFQSGMTNGQIFVAAQSEEIIFRGNDYLNDATMDYNESENISFQVDVNISDSTKVCAQPTLNLSPDINFTDGTNVVGGVTPSYVFENVGDFNVTMHEISGSEFALVDADDTADLDRLITPLERQIKVIPDHFVMNGSLSNGSNGFTYLSNFEAYPAVADRNVSALLDLNITAQAFDNNVTSNYTSTCYAKDGNLTMTLPAALNIAPLSKMIWYDTAHDLNGSIVLGGTSYPLPFVAAQFDSADENGTASVNYRLNFDRNETIAINPFTMTVNSVDANDTDAVSGNIALNSTVNYVYGRIIPRDVRVFGAGTPFVANAWYEVFNTPTIGTMALPVSKNDAQWNTNVVHVDFSDGDGFVTQSQINGANSVNAVAIGANSISGVATYTYTGLPLGAYKEHIETFPWLWYGVNAQMYIDPAIGNNINNCITHPCFNINVVPAVGATGSAETGAEAVKANKASTTTGGGTWNSTSDYAPAVR